MRKTISMMLDGDPEIEVVATARDGVEACEKVAELRPDVVTLDIEMPRMDGLTALRKIMASNPVPVLMVSSLTREGAAATMEALQAGALDFVPKESSGAMLAINRIREELVGKVKAVARSKHVLARHQTMRPASRPRPRLRLGNHRVLLIGTSTGGPFALQQIVPRLPAEFPLPVLIVQHMPPHFTKSLADRLNSISPLNVREASAGDVVRPGEVLIAPGGRHMTFERRGDDVVVVTPLVPETLHRPSVDVMFDSACQVIGGRPLGVVMTGMGRDGREGSRTIKERGGTVIAQDEESSVVFGMPRAVIEAGLADVVAPLDDIAPLCVEGVMNRLALPA